MQALQHGLRGERRIDLSDRVQEEGLIGDIHRFRLVDAGKAHGR